MKYVYLIVINHHNHAKSEYIACGSKEGADSALEETIRKRYLQYTDAETEESISEAISNGFFESVYGDKIYVSKLPVRI